MPYGIAGDGGSVLYRGDTHLGTAPRGWRGALWSIRTRLLLKLFSGYLSVGQRAHEYLLRHGVPQSRIFSAPHCVDIETFANTATSYQTKSERHVARASFGFAAGEFVVLFVGKLDWSNARLMSFKPSRDSARGARLLDSWGGKVGKSVPPRGREIRSARYLGRIFESIRAELCLCGS